MMWNPVNKTVSSLARASRNPQRGNDIAFETIISPDVRFGSEGEVSKRPKAVIWIRKIATMAIPDYPFSTNHFRKSRASSSEIYSVFAAVSCASAGASEVARSEIRGPFS